MNIKTPKLYDLLIIGGGPAGMSAALVAGRCRLSTVIINAENPRNSVTTASHGFLTRDGIHPFELLRIAKAQLTKYPDVEYLNAQVASVSKANHGFQANLVHGGLMQASKIIIATGFRDDLAILNLNGIKEVYGKSVYPCPFCDGFEHADQRTALFGADGVEHYAPLLKMWTDDLVIFTNGRDIPTQVVANLLSNEVKVYTQQVKRLHARDGILSSVELIDGPTIDRDCGFLWDDAGQASNDFAEQLGVIRKDSPWGGTMLDADQHGKTNIEGVFVIGDARTGFSGLMSSASEGGGCVEHIVHELSKARWLSSPEVC